MFIAQCSLVSQWVNNRQQEQSGGVQVSILWLGHSRRQVAASARLVRVWGRPFATASNTLLVQTELQVMSAQLSSWSRSTTGLLVSFCAYRQLGSSSYLSSDLFVIFGLVSRFQGVHCWKKPLSDHDDERQGLKGPFIKKKASIQLSWMSMRINWSGTAGPQWKHASAWQMCPLQKCTSPNPRKKKYFFFAS